MLTESTDGARACRSWTCSMDRGERGPTPCVNSKVQTERANANNINENKMLTNRSQAQRRVCCLQGLEPRPMPTVGTNVGLPLPQAAVKETARIMTMPKRTAATHTEQRKKSRHEIQYKPALFMHSQAVQKPRVRSPITQRSALAAKEDVKEKHSRIAGCEGKRLMLL